MIVSTKLYQLVNLELSQINGNLSYFCLLNLIIWKEFYNRLSDSTKKLVKKEKSQMPFSWQEILFLPGINNVLISVPDNRSVLLSVPRVFFTAHCFVCETDVKIETLLTFSSINAKYQLLVSHSQLVGHDYSYWALRCSGKLFSFPLLG